MDALNRGRNNLIAASALVLFAVLYYSLIYRYGLNLSDEGSVALISQRLMHGERPFRDVSLGYNVLWFYPISTLFRVFGTHLLLMRAYFYAISTGSGLIAFFLLRRLDAPFWLAFAQALIVISISGQYFKAYVPFLVLSNLFAITLFLTTQRKTLLSLGAGILLGTTYLIRIDIGIFFSAVWFGVVLLHAILLDRQIRLNLIVAGNLLLGLGVLHLPFLYDAYHRHFLPQFAGQYSTVASLILKPVIPQAVQKVTENPERMTFATEPDPSTGIDPKETIFISPAIEKHLIVFLRYAPPLLIFALFLAGCYLRMSNRFEVDRWLLFSALLGGSLAAFPQFYLFRSDLPHLIGFMNGGLVGLTCGGWLLWSSRCNAGLSLAFFCTIGWVAICYLLLAVPNPYGGTIAMRMNRHTRFRGANGVDVLLTKNEFEDANALFSATIWNSTKKDYVACYPYLPGVNFITARPTFQKFLDLNNVIQSEDWQQIEIAKIQKFRPAVIVIDDQPIQGTEESRFSQVAAQMTKFIENHYRPVASENNKRVFALLTPGMSAE
jgi:hypothetical protein